MKKEDIYTEPVAGEAESAAGECATACGREPHDNMADDAAAATDTMADDAAQSETDAAAEWRDKFLRLQAEFDNYRKRTLREKMELVETGGKKVLLAMLPVRDDVQRALAAMGKSDDAAAIREGVELIAQKFTESLRQQGVTEIAALDAPFDPDLHEAVAKFAAGEEKRGRVIDVVQAGYMLGDKVLRFAKVVVGE
ncbi:nucleotide exchange factor GrpE [uncultured Alistipes sp.]|uniref:nucleotide exchange factor GrpE n=1 Tax=uncultured Alistipes sp. TaxID=538949 RepID=UPI0025CCB346|nr:nucleotide exchange factor GrpE [uncultured Alistipes sp.]